MGEGEEVKDAESDSKWSDFIESGSDCSIGVGVI
jgi:hypothetical protein